MGFHLIHPALVHFAVAFLIAGGATEALGILLGRERMGRFGGVLVLMGTAALVPVVASGFLAATLITLPPGSEVLLGRHEKVGLTVLGLFLILTLWKAWGRGEVPARHRIYYALALLAGVGLVLLEAWLGGMMVYGRGVGVVGL